MKNGQWLKRAEQLLQKIPKQMLVAWEENNPGASICEVWQTTRKWQKIGNYSICGILIFFCLFVLQAMTESNPDIMPSLVAMGIFWALMLVTDFRLISPETRIDQLKRSVATLEECGLIPPNGFCQDGRDEICKYAHIRITENAFLVRNAEVGLKSLKTPPVVAVAIATESILLFKNRFNRAIKVAVEFGLSDGVADRYFREAEERISTK